MDQVKPKPGKVGRPFGSRNPYPQFKVDRDALIRKFYADGHSTNEIAKIFGMTRARAAQIIGPETRTLAEAMEVRDRRRKAAEG